MKHSDDLFPPETIDEQIDYLASQQNPRWRAVVEDSDMQDALNARLVHDLQNLTQDDERMLAQTRARLAAAYEARNATSPAQQPASGVSEQETMKIAAWPVTQQRPKRPERQRMIRILSGLVAILVIGSMLAIFALNDVHLRNQFIAQPTATPTPVKKPTPAGFYTVFNEKTVVRIDPNQKKAVWFYNLPASEAFSGSIIVDGDIVYATEEDTVYALDAATGQLRWEKVMPDVLKNGPPMVWNNRLYVVASQGDLYELQPGNGSVLHTYHLPFGAKFSTYRDQNILYVIGKTEVATIDLNDGQMQWKRQLTTDTNTVITDIQVSDGVMLANFFTQAPHIQSNIQAFDVATGDRLWTLAPINKGWYVARLQNGTVYYSASDTRVLHAYNIREKKELWRKNLADTIFEMSILNSNTLQLKLGEYVLQSDNSSIPQIKELITIDLQHGATKGQYPDPQQQNNNSNIGLMTWSVNVQSDGTFVYMNLSGDAKTGSLTYIYTAFSPTCKQLWQVSFVY